MNPLRDNNEGMFIQRGGRKEDTYCDHGVSVELESESDHKS